MTDPTVPAPPAAAAPGPPAAESIPDVRKHVVVPAGADHCFRVFTEQPADWWPPSHVLLDEPRVALGFETGLGGRYYERGASGAEIDWGRILVWEPPYRLSMTWRVDGRWRSIPDDDRASRIDVTFTPVGAEATRVELAHVELHRHGVDGHAIHRALDGPSPGETLERFLAAATP